VQDTFDGGAPPSGGIIDKIKALPLQKVLMFGVPALVIIIAAIIFLPMIFGSGSSGVTDSIIMFGDKDEIVISGNNNNKFSIFGEYRQSQSSIDFSKVAVLTDYDYTNGGVLWFVTTSKAVKVADDVLAFKISDTGKGIVYLTDHDSRNNEATLFLYDTSRGNATKIAEDAMYVGDGQMNGVCISPDGKSVAYISDYDPSDDSVNGYMKIGNRAPEKVGSNMYAIAISDGGRHMYYVKQSNEGVVSLHVKSGRNENRLISDVSSSITLRLNKDYSQAVFNHDGRAYITKNGGERDRFYSQTVSSFLLPPGTPWGQHSGSGRINVTVYGLRSLTPAVIMTSDGLVRIDNKYESNKIASSYDYMHYASISANGKTLLFITNNGHLASIDPTRSSAERKEVGRNVDQYVASADAKTIYFVNEDDELYFVRGNGSPTKVADDVDGPLVMQWNSSRAFFVVDMGRRGGELYSTNNGRGKTKVSGGDEVNALLATPRCIFYGNYDDEIFRSNGNDRFTRFAEDMNYLR